MACSAISPSVRRLSALVLALLLGAPAWATSPPVPLDVPRRIVLPESVDATDLAQAIKVALTNRKWTVQADTGSAVRGQIEVRGHVLQMEISYGEREVSFRYVDSLAMDYRVENGVAYIHPTGNKWLYRLANEVRDQVQRVVEGQGAAVVPSESDTEPE